LSFILALTNQKSTDCICYKLLLVKKS
jgi:hypothetical protein